MGTVEEMKNRTAQSLFNSEFLEKKESNSNETLDLLNFMKNESVHLTQQQLTGMMFLNEMGLTDISETVMKAKAFVTPVEILHKTIDKLTMADRIKGNAKLSHLMKTDGSVANPAKQLKASDVQAQGMSTREIDRY